MKFEITAKYDIESGQVDLWVSDLEKMPLILELSDILNQNCDVFTKSFHFKIEVDEEEKKFYATCLHEEGTSRQSYKNLNGGRLFVLLHTLMDMLDGVRWDIIIQGGKRIV